MTKPLETAGDLYIDTYGTLRELRAADCGCCLEGVIDGADGDTGEPWQMPYSIPRDAVVPLGAGAPRLPAGARDACRKAQPE